MARTFEREHEPSIGRTEGNYDPFLSAALDRHASRRNSRRAPLPPFARPLFRDRPLPVAADRVNTVNKFLSAADTARYLRAARMISPRRRSSRRAINPLDTANRGRDTSRPAPASRRPCGNFRTATFSAARGRTLSGTLALQHDFFSTSAPVQLRRLLRPNKEFPR